MAEFIESGYAGTDTNRIARRAGFAPQTFYRWFADKTAILRAVSHDLRSPLTALLGVRLCPLSSNRLLVNGLGADFLARGA